MLGDADVLVDFTQPDQALGNAREALAAGVHVVIGTSGFDQDGLREAAASSEANAFFAPNFAIGAVLMMRFAAEASRIMDRAEIIELHHPASSTRPSGTAARTAEMMEGDVPIHSVRLPGLVADQEVILGDVAQTLSIRHVTTDRTSFMPGVLLADPRRRRPARVPDDRARAPAVALVAVTDHAVERYGQRVRGDAGPAHGDRRRGSARALAAGRREPRRARRGARARRAAPAARLRVHGGPPRGELIVVTL